MTNNKIAELIKETEKELKERGKCISHGCCKYCKEERYEVRHINYDRLQAKLSAYKQCQEIMEGKKK